MPHEIVFSSAARRGIIAIPQRIRAAIVEFVYGDLAASPRRVGKPLQRELTGLFAARRGTYRVIYEIDNDRERVIIIRIAHRADAYR